MKEKDIQDKIVKSVQKQGGKAAKLQGAFTLGVPDLYVLFPTTVSLLSEVKYLGAKARPRLNDPSIKVPLRPMQLEVMKGFEAVKTKSTVVLIGVTIQGETFLYAVNPLSERLHYNRDLRVPLNGKWFDMINLLGTYVQG